MGLPKANLNDCVTLMLSPGSIVCGDGVPRGRGRGRGRGRDKIFDLLQGNSKPGCPRNLMPQMSNKSPSSVTPSCSGGETNQGLLEVTACSTDRTLKEMNFVRYQEKTEDNPAKLGAENSEHTSEMHRIHDHPSPSIGRGRGMIKKILEEMRLKELNLQTRSVSIDGKQKVEPLAREVLTSEILANDSLSNGVDTKEDTTCVLETSHCPPMVLQPAEKQVCEVPNNKDLTSEVLTTAVPDSDYHYHANEVPPSGDNAGTSHCPPMKELQVAEMNYMQYQEKTEDNPAKLGAKNSEHTSEMHRIHDHPSPSIGRGRGMIKKILEEMRLKELNLQTRSVSIDEKQKVEPLTREVLTSEILANDSLSNGVDTKEDTTCVLETSHCPPMVLQPAEKQVCEVPNNKDLTSEVLTTAVPDSDYHYHANEVPPSGDNAGTSHCPPMKELQVAGKQEIEHLASEVLTSEIPASDSPSNEVHAHGDTTRDLETSHCPPVVLQAAELEEMLRWFYMVDTAAVNLEYLERLYGQPVCDTDTLIDSFTPAQVLIRKFNLALAKVRLLLGPDSKILLNKVLTDMLNTNCNIPNISDWENQLITCYLFWFDVVKQITSPETEKKLSHLPNSFSLANTYIKAAFLGIFGLRGCRRALTVLLLDLEDDASEGELELLFLKARILGKLRYLEQRPADQWEQEERLILHVIKVIKQLQNTLPGLATRAQVYLAEFHRLRGYRRFIETRKSFAVKDCRIEQDYQKSFELIKSLEKPLQSSPTGMAWRAEQLFKLPTKGYWHDIYYELAFKSLKTITTKEAYCLRMMALAHDKTIEISNREKMAEQQRWREKVDLTDDDVAKEMKLAMIEYLDMASALGCVKAQLERVSYLYQFDRKKDMMPVLEALPDASIHIAAYLAICKNNFIEAQYHLRPYHGIYNIYLPLLVHYPACFRLFEPINLVNVVFPERRVTSTYLKSREDILGSLHMNAKNKRPKTVDRFKQLK